MGTTAPTTPSLDQVNDQALYQIRVNVPLATTGPGSSWEAFARTVGATAWPLYLTTTWATDQIFPSTAGPVALAKHAQVARLPRRNATPALAMILVLGTNGTAIAAGTTYSAPGSTYTTDALATIATPAWSATTCVWSSAQYPDRIRVRSTTGMAVGDPFTWLGKTYAIRALPGGDLVIIYGLITNFAIGDPVAPAAGALIPATATAAGKAGNLAIGTALSPTATLMLAAGGADAWTDTEWGSAIERAVAARPAGGNPAQLWAWTLGYLSEDDRKKGVVAPWGLGVDRAYVFRTPRGPCTADVIAQGMAGTRRLTVGKLAAIAAGVAPMLTVGTDIQWVDWTPLASTFYVKIKGGPGILPDWDDLFVVDAGATTATIPVDTRNPIGIIQVGHRVAIWTGTSVEIRRVVNVLPTALKLDAALSVAPAAGEYILPGSDLVAAAWEQVSAMYAAMSPAGALRFPAQSADDPSELNDTLIKGYLFRAAGVAVVDIQTPASAVVPGYKEQVVPSAVRIQHVR